MLNSQIPILFAVEDWKRLNIEGSFWNPYKPINMPSHTYINRLWSIHHLMTAMWRLVVKRCRRDAVHSIETQLLHRFSRHVNKRWALTNSDSQVEKWSFSANYFFCKSVNLGFEVICFSFMAWFNHIERACYSQDTMVMFLDPRYAKKVLRLLRNCIYVWPHPPWERDVQLKSDGDKQNLKVLSRDASSSEILEKNPFCRDGDLTGNFHPIKIVFLKKWTPNLGKAGSRLFICFRGET